MDATELWPWPDRRERWLKLIELLDPRPGDRVLEVGCGSGQALQFIARRIGPAGRAVGVEYGPNAATRLLSARDATGCSPFEPVKADAQVLPFADETFDAVLCVNVLEAVPDRLGALREMRRVLQPGGRALVAHDDYESQVYACADRELGRRVVRAYADATFASYATSDGQMGRHLRGIFQLAGFRDPALHVLPLVNTEYREPLLGWVLAQFSAELIAQVSDLTQAELDRWHADLEERSARGEYLYCVNLYSYLGRK
ncbi:MAG TPA: methyltransferase domain-containing protein [Chloroflexota bacterium]|nr:methyltransferase domain-containing protein [Chloroflexota bacterium]